VDETFIDIKDLEKRTKLPRSWWYSQVSRGYVPYYKCGKYLRFKISEVDAWLEKHRRGGGNGHGS